MELILLPQIIGVIISKFFIYYYYFFFKSEDVSEQSCSCVLLAQGALCKYHQITVYL